MSGQVAVVTDSTADIAAGLAAERGITVVPLTVLVDGQEYLDGVEIRPDEFYRRLAVPGTTATTSQPSPGRFADVYSALLEDHAEVVSIHISGSLSGTYAAACQGAELSGEAARVHVVDSRLASMPLALLVLAAASMGKSGLTAAAIEGRVDELRARTSVVFMVGTLEYLRRGGRIGAASALVGSVLQVKPVLTIQDGQVAPLERVRTHERALARVIELAAGDGDPLCAIVGHAAAEESALRIAAALEARCESILVAELGPVVGAHAGPGTVGVGAYPAGLFPLGLKRLDSLAAR